MKALTHIKCRLLRTDTDWSSNKSDDDDDSANNNDQMTVMIIMTTTTMIESEDDDDDARWQGTEATKMATARWFKGWQVVLPTSHSLSCYVVPVRSEKSAAHAYTSTSQPWYKKVQHAYVYFVLSATDQVKAVRELTQHVRQTTSEVSEQDVGETTRRRNGWVWWWPWWRRWLRW